MTSTTKQDTYLSQCNPFQETIDAYLASCRRGKAVPSPAGDDDGDDNEEEDDPETSQEFSDFKKWLDETTPSSSDNKPSEALVEKNPCKKCGLVSCD